MATLGELRETLLPAARWVTLTRGAEAAAREIAWVRVMKARVPAFDGLEAGDLAIVSASALAIVAPVAADIEALVDASALTRIGGLLLVDADGASPAGGSPLDTLAEAAARAGIPALRMDHADTAALERSVIGFLVNRRAELDHQAALLEARLERLAIAGSGLAGLVAAVGEVLGRAVALEGRRGEPLAVHAPADRDEAAAAVAGYHARPRSVALRVPLSRAGAASGSIALLGDRAATELERIVVARVAGLIALEVVRDDDVRRARDAARRAESLPAAGPPWAVLVARQRVPGEEQDVAARERIRRDLRSLAPARKMTLRGDADSVEIRIVVAVEAADPDATIVAARIAAALRRTVALSRPFTTAAERPASEADARATLEAAEALPERPAVARADRLPAYRLLGNLHNVPDGPRLARALLEPLLRGRRDVRREHLATLRAVLDHPGLAEAAAALGVHRNTVAYRVRRIEAVTGWRLGDPDLRLPLGLALRLVQTDQEAG
ncbi:MAG TPA: helix-turn-helix domain-containing protein [Candidatus Limnocylindrales bacterium]